MRAWAISASATGTRKTRAKAREPVRKKTRAAEPAHEPRPASEPTTAGGRVIQGDCLDVLRSLPDGSVDLVYVDPPFNTGKKKQKRDRVRTVRDEEGDRTGFSGRRYRTEKVSQDAGFEDRFDDFLAFLEPRLREAHRVLSPTGSFYFHIDYREVHYCKVLLDTIFGRASFLNEIIWAYDYGARSKSRWPAKHDNILFYAKDPARYHFDTEEVDRIRYMAPELVGAVKAKLGKLPTDTWWHTIVSPTGKEKVGYPTQKPLGILRRIIRASCPKDGLVLDFFAGSGTTGVAARESGRRFLLVDVADEAIATMRRRFEGASDVSFGPRASGAEAPPPPDLPPAPPPDLPPPPEPLAPAAPPEPLVQVGPIEAIELPTPPLPAPPPAP